MKYILIIIIYFLSSTTYSKEISFKVLYLKGDARLTMNGAVVTIKKKMKLKTPFSIRTNKNSLVLLKNKKMTVRVDEQSVFSFSKEDADMIKLKKGSVLVNYIKSKLVDKYRLEVETKNVSLGVRGTTFFVLSLNDGRSFATVKEGEVEIKGRNSKNYIAVKKGRSAILNKEQRNLRPKEYSFQKYISWNYDNAAKNMENGSELISSFEKSWNKYKNHQEFIWKEYKKNQSDSWESWKNSNRRN